MELTVQNVYGLLIRSKLLPVDQIKALFDRWNQEAGSASTNLVKFTQWLVSNRFLTEYQATLLARGYADGFFLNQYKILDRLGKGRMAGVYKAQHETGPIVAIKVLPPSSARDRALLSRFRREAKIATRMKHPNVVRTFEVGRSRDAVNQMVYYLVMEFLEGETLQEWLERKKRLDPAEAVRLVYQALLGLQHLHEQGLVHRDLKPSNLMLARPLGTGPTDEVQKVTLKILDLGLGRALVEELGPNQPTTEHSALTTEGALLGTPDYMSPEQARDARSADIRADIYSLGCVLYQLMAGHPPFPDTNVISQMIRHATEEPKPLPQINSQVPDGLQQIVSWMMKKDPAQRYPTPERAAQALQVFLVAGAEHASVTPEADPKMKKYLTYLDTKRQKKDDAGEAGETKKSDTDRHKTMPQAKVATPARAPDQNKAKEAKKGRRRSKRKRRKGAVASENLDVELVSMSPSDLSPDANLFSFRFSRRDMVMFGAGVLTVLVGTGIGALLAWAFGAF